MNSATTPISRWVIALVILVIGISRSEAHDQPTSFIDLHLRSSGMEVSLTASTTDLAHDFPNLEPRMFLDPATLQAQQKALEKIIQERLKLTADGGPVAFHLSRVVPVPDKRDVQMLFTASWVGTPAKLGVAAHLFPYDPQHRTYLNIYENDRLQRQEILTGTTPSLVYTPGSEQKLGAIVVQFFLEGIHHIFIGPDHILFVLGLILPGIEIRRLLKIVTAFTIAHSITLGLATFQIVTPSPSFIEPMIAFSIVAVGINALLVEKKQDPRLLLAFCFGLIHGFGFANALQEMMLPRHALGWSLVTFNAGVEVGQACIILAATPILAWLFHRRHAIWKKVVNIGAYGVITAGSFWFFQRILG